MKHTRKTLQDETRYCEQCGISYIWTIEEQRAPLLAHSKSGHRIESPITAENIGGATEDSVIDADIDGLLSPMSEPLPVGNQSEPPIHCPGCRQLLPVSGRERGVVKWYNRRKGYGFIVRQSAPEIYVNRNALRRGHLRPDEFVEFEVTENQQGPVAAKVTLLKSEH